MEQYKRTWKSYIYEFTTIFLGVSLAFMMNKCNEDHNRFESSEKTLLEIRNGLELDLQDFRHNMKGHKVGIALCDYFRDYINDKPINKDSISDKYKYLFRDFISIQNESGYEALKSRGLELVKNDSLRLEIISLYDFYYEIVQKLEEHYTENQYTENYFKDVNDMLADNMHFNDEGELIDLSSPVNLSKRDKNIFLSYLLKIEQNRSFTLDFYTGVEEKIIHLIDHIEADVD